MVACRKDKAREGTGWGVGSRRNWQNSARFWAAVSVPFCLLASESRGLLQSPLAHTPTSQTGTQSPGAKHHWGRRPRAPAQGGREDFILKLLPTAQSDLMPLGGWDASPLRLEAGRLLALRESSGVQAEGGVAEVGWEELEGLPHSPGPGKLWSRPCQAGGGGWWREVTQPSP